MGVPRVYCDCAVCSEARQGGENNRLRPLVHLADEQFGQMLIDCGPDWRKQMESAGLRRIDRMLITHAHFDHIGGLAEWADMCRWLQIKGEAYAMPDVIEEINSRFPWLHRQIAFIPISAEGPPSFGGWQISCWKVNHGKNGYAYAFKFSHPATSRAWAYCSDAIALPEEQLAPLRGLDLLVLGTSFYYEPFPFETRSVYDVTEALEVVAECKPRRTIFTHMSHDIDLRRDYGLPDNVSFATTGLAVNV